MAPKRVKKPRTAATAQALDQLVSQFAQPLAFLRELVQNSLDASTELIEVDVDYDPEAEACFVRVRDTGVGMDRDIIDTKLTRLFASSKENDLTKIGKFGIGFVSIFAIQPALVVLETGRDGESWRLLFKPDRSFERHQLPTPVEGTTVTVFLTRPMDQLARLQQDCRDTIAFWCRHADVEIQFNGRPVNEPFDLPGLPFTHRHQVDGTDVVVAPTPQAKGFHGYYNRGLTLLEGSGSPLPHVAFKLRSRYLEHTLSRDNVLIDEGYAKAMAEVEVAAYRDMPEQLLTRLVQRDSPELWSLARVVLKYPDPAREAFGKVAVFPSHGRRLLLSQVPDPAYLHPRVDDYWHAVESTGRTLVLADLDHPCATLLRDLGRQVLRLDAHFLHYTLVEPAGPEQDLLAGLAQADRTLPRLVLVRGIVVPPAWKGRFCGAIDPSIAVAHQPVRTESAPRAVGIFGEHPFWAKLLALHGAQPELAYCLGSRKISLVQELGTDGDGKLFGRLVKSLRSKTVPA